MAQLEQSGARPVDEEANAEVLGFNKHQTFMALGRRLKQEEELALTTEKKLNRCESTKTLIWLSW